MASQGPTFAGTGANDSGNGGSVAWTNPNNIASGSNATCALDCASGYWLKATNFGFTIPAGATINGIVVEVDKKSDQTGTIIDDGVYLVQPGTPLPRGANKADATQWPAAFAYTTYGASSDVWGFGTLGGTVVWTPTLINNSGFGVLIAASEQCNAADVAYVNRVRVAVYYTAAVAPVADFTGTPLSGTASLSVAFTDSSTNTPTSWLWEKSSDGGSNWSNFAGTPTVQNPAESFAAGTWSVRLTATNAGGSNTKTRTNYITATQPVPTNSVAPSCSPSSGTTAATFAFSSGTWTGSPTSYETSASVDGGGWTVVDTSAGGSPSLTGTQLGGPGTITTRVRAQNAGGWSDYVSGTTVTVTSPPPPSPPPPSHPPPPPPVGIAPRTVGIGIGAGL